MSSYVVGINLKKRQTWMTDLWLLQRLKTSLHYTVGELSKERGKELQVQFDKQLVAAVSSITHQYLDTCASDLQAFAK